MPECLESQSVETRSGAEEMKQLLGIQTKDELAEARENFRELLAILREWDERDNEQKGVTSRSVMDINNKATNGMRREYTCHRRTSE